MNGPHIEAQRWLRQAQANLAVVRTLHAAGHHARGVRSIVNRRRRKH